MQIATVTLLAMAAGLSAAVDHHGKGTYYTQDGAAGSCGQYHSDNDKIVALPASWNVSKFCGRTVTITNNGHGSDNNNGKGKVVVATVADTCPGCGHEDLDLSVGTFKALDDGYVGGTLDITWHFNA